MYHRNLMMWLVLQGLVMMYLVQSKQYYFIIIPLVLIFVAFGGRKWFWKLSGKCKHQHIIHTKEYDYCYSCGKKVNYFDIEKG